MLPLVCPAFCAFSSTSSIFWPPTNVQVRIHSSLNTHNTTARNMKRPAPRAPGFGSAWTALEPALTPWIADVIAGQGFERMTPVQAGTIPRAVKHQDCVVEVSGQGNCGFSSI